MSQRVLHVLSQRPGRTGSGVTLEATVRRARDAGWTQAVVVGTPAEDPHPRVDDLDESDVHPLVFGAGALDFPLPGMSDVMPYPSSRFADLDAAAIQRYRRAWSDHLAAVVSRFAPDVIHAHHAWIVSSLVKDVAPDVPVVTQSHATGLRQMRLCPHLAEGVREGLRRNDVFLALSGPHARDLSAALEVDAVRVVTVGAGYRDDLFRPPLPGTPREEAVLYAGKLSRAKGLPWLLDAFERLAAKRPALRLHVAGGGGGEEADHLRARLAAWAPDRVVVHGPVDQARLAELMRGVRVLVLPSFFEGLPLVLVEAVASGCDVVVTDLDVVREDLAPRLGPRVRTVPLPRRRHVDVPEPADLPAFVDALERTIAAALDEAVTSPPSAPPADFTWDAVFRRIERVWRGVADEGG